MLALLNIILKSGTLKGLTDHIRILHIGCLLGVFDLDVRLFFSILAQKRPGPTDEKIKKKNQVSITISEKHIDFDIFTQKKRMILVVKSSKKLVNSMSR